MTNSFEEPGSWGSGLTAYDQSFSHNGRISGRIDAPGTAEVTSMSSKWLTISLTAPKKFHYSGWVYSNGPTVEIYLFMKRAGETGYNSYVNNVYTPVRDKWVFLEGDYAVPADVTQLNIRIDNNGTLNGGNKVWFDDIRLYPSDAQMTTYTYEPLVGVTSMADARGLTTSYEYDGFQRLKTVRNNDGNIIKSICYNYAGQQTGCTLSAPPVVTPPGGGGNSIYVRMEDGSGYLGSDGHYYGTYIFRTYSDANYTIPYNVPSSYAVQYRVTSTTTTSGGSSTTSSSVYTATIASGSNSKSVTVDVNTCGQAPPPSVAAKGETSQTSSLATASGGASTNGVPGGSTSCTTSTVALVNNSNPA
jgi:YD repeat-containing protein